MKLRADVFILDLDGTLIDSKQGILESFSAAVKSVFPERNLDMAKVPIGPPIRGMCRSVFPWISEAEMELLVKAYRGNYDSTGCMNTRLYEGARILLSKCAESGRAVDVATNKPWRVTSAVLSHLEVARFFRSVMAVDSIQPPFASKTDIMRHLLNLNRANLDRTIYVGDTAEDAAAAKACGIGFVWASYGYGRLEEGQESLAVINRLADLEELL
ncbi:MAG TPA: HAD hydrolase-like protein [Verrucomicrobiae bacterium]|jgi:phosphoglycolate phosphatase